MAATQKAIEIEIESGIESGIEDELEVAERAARVRNIKVVDVFTGIECELPGDTATRDARTLAHFSHPSGAVVPLVMRPAGADFYVCGDRWPELRGSLVRRCA